MTWHQEIVSFVQLAGDRPHTVVTRTGDGYAEYRFHLSGRLGRLFFHKSGEMDRQPLRVLPGEPYWADPLAELVNASEGERLAELLPPLTPELIFTGAEEEASPGTYCHLCDDYQPESWECGHVFWCEPCGGYAGPGNTEARHCRHPDPNGLHGPEAHGRVMAVAKSVLEDRPADEWVLVPVVRPQVAGVHPFRKGREFWARRDGALLVLYRRKKHRRKAHGDNPELWLSWEWALYSPDGELVSVEPLDGKKPPPPFETADAGLPRGELEYRF